MNDVVEAVHPVPVHHAPRRSSRTRWTMAETRTSVRLPRVDESAVRPAFAIRLTESATADTAVVEIEGRLFVEAGVSPAGERAVPLGQHMAGTGCGYRNLNAAATLLVGSPAAGMPLGLDHALAHVGGHYADYRGEVLPPGSVGRIVEDATDRARAALADFVARNVRLAGDRSFVDAGGPLAADMAQSVFALRYAPRGCAHRSLVRLAPSDIEAYAGAVGFRGAKGSGLKGVPSNPWPSVAEADATRGDLMFVNAAPGILLGAAAPHLRRMRKDADTPPGGHREALERIVRHAYLGSVGLIGIEDAGEVLADVARAADAIAALPVPSGVRSDAWQGLAVEVDRIRKDARGWVMPRVAAHDARHDADDVPYLSV